MAFGAFGDARRVRNDRQTAVVQVLVDIGACGLSSWIRPQQAFDELLRRLRLRGRAAG